MPGFLPVTLGGLVAWDDFHRADAATLHLTGTPSGHVYRGSGHVETLQLTENAYAPQNVPGQADILFVDHDRDYETIAARYKFTAGTSNNQNAVIGSCAQFFGTNRAGGSLQLAIWASTQPGGFDWQLFAVTDPVTDPYPVITQGLFADGFAIATDGVTEYVSVMRRTGDTQVTIELPDGQVITATSDHVRRWGKAFGIQGRRQGTSDGYIVFTGIASSQMPIHSAADGLPPLPAGAALYLPGDVSNKVATQNVINFSADVEAIFCGTLDSWASGAAQGLIAKWPAQSSSWVVTFYLNSVGKLRLDVVLADGTLVSAVATTGVPFVDGQTGWLKATRDSSTGATKFYTSSNGTSWTQLGTTVTATAGALRQSDAEVTIGQHQGASPLHGHIHKAVLNDGIGGSLLAGLDFISEPYTGVDDHGNGWRITGTGWRWQLPPGSVAPGTAVANTADTGDTATKLNALLASLRVAGVINS